MKVYKIGVVADTHVPDRVKNLHPGLIPALKELGVHLILHAGDICNSKVIEELKTAAPVISVLGNRDLLFNQKYRTTEIVKVNGVTVGLMHGCGNLQKYIIDKFQMFLRGYQFRYYANLLSNTLPESDVIIFGHTHRPENRWVDGRLILNPGSTGLGRNGSPPSFGLICIYENGNIGSEILQLRGAKLEKGKWVYNKSQINLKNS